ncbi:MAG: hypothetical protein HYX34_04135 [Actinobacteria bacterium]|nr:hypothetical protein [Actinomycetota bacterium]
MADHERDDAPPDHTVLTGEEEADPDGGGTQGDGPIDRMRGTGVGLEDPNIVGDVGPTDVAPGADPEPLVVEADEGEDPHAVV